MGGKRSASRAPLEDVSAGSSSGRSRSRRGRSARDRMHASSSFDATADPPNPCDRRSSHSTAHSAGFRARGYGGVLPASSLSLLSGHGKLRAVTRRLGENRLNRRFSNARRFPALLSLVVLLTTSVWGPFLVVCRAPGGHSGAKLLIFRPTEEQLDCCDCLTCQVPSPASDTPESSSIGPEACQQACRDASLTHPFTNAISRSHETNPLSPPIFSLAPVAGLLSTQPVAAIRLERASPVLKFIRTTVLLI
jgi:hypothetical protein